MKYLQTSLQRSGGISRIDGDYGARDIAAAFAQEKLNTARHVDRLGHALQCAGPRDFLALRIGELMRHLRVDKARCQRIHRNTQLPDLACERTCESDQGG